MYLTTDNWETHENIGSNFDYQRPSSIVQWKNGLYAAGSFGIAHADPKNPRQWTIISDTSRSFRYPDLVPDDSALFAASYDGLYWYNTTDTTWRRIAFADTSVNDMVVLTPDSLYAAATDKGIYTWNPQRGSRLIGIRDTNVSELALEPNGNLLIANHKGVYRIQNAEGGEFQEDDTNLINPIPLFENAYIHQLYSGSTGTYVTTTNYTYRYHQKQQQWTPLQIPNPMVTKINFDTDTLYASTFINGGYFYDREAQDWHDLNFQDETANDLIHLGEERYLISGYGGLHYTENGGDDWQTIDKGIYEGLYQTARGTILASKTGILLEYTSDLSSSSEVMNFEGDAYFRRFISLSDGTLISNSGGGIYTSADTGQSWQRSHDNLYELHQIPGTDGVAGIHRYPNYLLIYTRDGGVSWDTLNIPSNYESPRFVDENSIIAYAAGGDSTANSFYLSNDLGDSWQPVTSNLPEDRGLETLEIDSSGVAWIDLRGTGIYKTEELTDLITSYKPNVASRPHQIGLLQNYPNPFNPSTTLGFRLPEASSVSLKIYSITGKHVATLIDGQKYTAGTHRIKFSMSGRRHLASGVYLYRLKTSTSTLTRKMIYLK